MVDYTTTVSRSRDVAVLRRTKNYFTLVVNVSRFIFIYEPILGGTSVSPTSHVRASATLVLTIVEN